MNKITCPKCGETFQVDETSYNAIVTQIRNEEFEKQIREKEKQFTTEKNNAVAQAILETKSSFDKQLSDKSLEIEQLKNTYTQLLNEKELKISNLTTNTQIEVNKAIQQKDSEIERLKNQLSYLDNEKDAAVDKAVLAAKNNLNNQIANINKQLADKQLEIERLKNSYSQQLNEKDMKISNMETSSKLEINKVTQEKDSKIVQLENEISSMNKDFQLQQQNLKNEYETQLRLKEAEVEQYKDFKAKLSTKMIGESLEQHCQAEFETYRPLGFQNAYFSKDNDIKTGSKGDYIYRDFTDDGIEFVSIMFEMKNEADTTSTKKKNEDFFKELDKDRNEKQCEYAVLVSMLEIGNPLYDTGIVDVSHKYAKMYVIRPQFFILLITLIKNASLHSVEYKRELELVKNQNEDITNFENEMNNFKRTFSTHYNAASKKFKAAIKDIDDSIEHLLKVKSELIDSENALRLANQNAEDLSIKKLAKNSPTLLEKFEDLKKPRN